MKSLNELGTEQKDNRNSSPVSDSPSVESEEDRKRKRKINREFTLSFLFSVIGAVLGFVFSFLAARTLQADGYGEIQYYLSVSGLVALPITFGANNFVIKNVQFATDRKLFLSKIYVLLLLTSTITLPLYFMVAYFLLGRLHQDVLLIFIIFIMAEASSFSSIVVAALTGLNKNEIGTLLSSILPRVVFLTAFVIHYFTNSLDTFITMYMYYYIGLNVLVSVGYIVKNFKLKGGEKLFTKSELMTMLAFFLTWVCYNATTPIANVIIGEKYQEFGVVGIYSVSAEILSVAAIVPNIVISISYPVFSKLTKEKKADAIQKYFETATRIMSYFGIPFFVAFAFEAHQLLSLFGDSYLGYEWILAFLSISSVIECSTGPTGSILLMGGKEKENLFASIIRFVVFIGLLVGLIQVTVYAAPIAMIVSTLIANIFKLLFVNRFFHRNFFTRRIVLPLLVDLTVCSACFFGLSFINNVVIWLVANCLVGGGLIAASVIFSPFKEDQNFFITKKTSVIQEPN